MQGAEAAGMREAVAGGSDADGEDAVRVRAYHLWEEAGRPEGRDGEFWARASEPERQGASDGEASTPEAAPAPDLVGPLPNPGLLADAAGPELQERSTGPA